MQGSPSSVCDQLQGGCRLAFASQQFDLCVPALNSMQTLKCQGKAQGKLIKAGGPEQAVPLHKKSPEATLQAVPLQHTGRTHGSADDVE